MTDALVLFGITAEVSEPEPIPELRNFGVWTPDGVRDITSAFRQYHATMERFERMAIGERPRWMVEIDRFYRIQFGGADPIQTWLQVPMMYFEPPQACVLARDQPARAGLAGRPDPGRDALRADARVRDLGARV